MKKNCRTPTGTGQYRVANGEEAPWRFGGASVTGHEYIALGRRNWYSAFANALTVQLKSKVYLCDFMHWIDESAPERSLNYFIDSAERIDVNLRGLTLAELHRVTAGAGRRAARKSELAVAHMSCWEINQIYHGGHLDVTHWHVSDGMSLADAQGALGGRVGAEKIHEGTAVVAVGLGAREATAEQLLEFYGRRGRKTLAGLVRRIVNEQGSAGFSFYEGYGTLGLRKEWGSFPVLVEVTNLDDEAYVVQVHRGAEVVSWGRGVSALGLMALIGRIARGNL